MANTIDTIKEVAGKVAESYIFSKENMDDTIFNEVVGQSLNKEIIKRICEYANQNVYLSLFHNENTDRSNIQFDLANYNNIMEKLNKSESDMEDYAVSPNSFKSKLEIAVLPIKTTKSNIDTETEKVASVDKIVFELEKYKKFLSGLETMKVAESNSAIESFRDIFYNAKIMTHKGESLADMAKISMRLIKEEGLDITKIAKVYELVFEELENNGYNINKEITKTSSLTINKKSKLLQPVKSYMLSLSKVAGISEMIDNTKKIIGSYNNKLKEIAK